MHSPFRHVARRVGMASRRIAPGAHRLFCLLTLLAAAFSACQPPPHGAAGTDWDSVPLPRDTVRLGKMLDSLRLRNDKRGIAEVANRLGKSYRNESLFARAIVAHNEALAAAEAVGDHLQIVHTLNNLGTVYRRLGLFAVAADYHYKSLDVAQKLPQDLPTSVKAKVMSLNGLGNIYITLGNHALAEQTLRLALDGERQLGSALGMAINYANIGSIFESRGMIDSAAAYYDISMRLNREAGSDLGIALCHTYIGSVHEKRGEKSLAIKEYETAYTMMRDNNDEWHTLQPCLALARISMAANEKAKALQHLDKARRTALRINSAEHLVDIYKLYYALYNSEGDPRNALRAYMRADALTDSIMSVKTINEVQNVRMEMERTRHKRQVEQAELEAMRQKEQKLMGFAMLIATVIALTLIVHVLRNTKRINRLMAENNAKMEKQNAEITAGINYALRIQQSILPKLNFFRGYGDGGCFAFFMPCHIVSGDFYWARTNGSVDAIVCADCTGHGVPGAFMTMIGTTILNDLFAHSPDPTPAAMLEDLHESLIGILQQSGDENTRDGMDLTIVIFDRKRGKASVASAKRPVYLYRGGERMEIAAAMVKRGIGERAYNRENRPFRSVELDIAAGDTLYMGTDGLSDLFGGPGRRRFTKKRVMGMMDAIVGLPIEKQREAVERTYYDWLTSCGNIPEEEREQLDDVLFMGVRF